MDYVIDWDKAKVVDREAQRQTRWIDKRGTLDQEGGLTTETEMSLATA